MNDNYTYPLNTDLLMNAQKLKRLSAQESVRSHIYLILMTTLGEYAYDPKYGNALWERDFDVSVNQVGWESEMSTLIRENISLAEPRLSTEFRVDAKTVKYNEDTPNMKQQFVIQVTNMKLSETNENINNIEYSIVFSPISIN